MRVRRLAWSCVLVSLTMVLGVVSSASAAPPLGGLADSTLPREPLQQPDTSGDGSLSSLQSPDPTEGLALIDPPQVSSDGGAHLSYPLVLPAGRGISPDLSLSYDSAGGNGWVGQGWDLSVGDISVDTRWGAPYFDPNRESESYAIDGDPMVPNALGSTWQPRVHGDRQDYTRQVETDYSQIIRHEVAPGGPKNYFWEVHDKGGNVFWYGGKPDQGGPDGYLKLDDDASNDLTPTIDRNAIVTDEHGNGVSWLLSAQRDVGVNQISYHYDTLHYKYGTSGWTSVSGCTPSDSVLCASHTYLSSINYTEAATGAPAPDGDAGYQVVFKRESQVNPTGAVRADPIVSGMGGFVDLVNDRLARVEVYHGSYTVTGTDAEGNETRSARSYDSLAMRYDLGYTVGAFGKSLLASVSQVGTGGTTESTHTFGYANKVGTNADGYSGFDTAKDWNTGSDLPDRQLLDSDAAIGALGSSESNSAEGHAYIGFNPIVPEKVGSFGGSLQIGGGATEAIAEWLDINGDGLPDKVYRDSAGVTGDPNDVNRNGPIRYRLNTSGPDASVTPTFGPERTVTGITKLSTDGNFGLEEAFEAFPGISVAFGLGAEVSWGDAYFSDANGDGLPDYVSGGKVWFNHLGSAGDPVFVQGDSSDTPVPVDDTAAATAPVPDQVADAQQQLEANNPLVDTVRRWTAPFTGAISIDAPVTLQPLSGTSPDGVRVAMQHNGNEFAAATLTATGAVAFGAPVTRNVTAGDRLYFRVGSTDNGAHDDVSWSPTISYTTVDGQPAADIPTDENGLSQTTFKAADDFTLSGRPDTQVFMPLEGTVSFDATIHKTATTDDVDVVLQHNGTAVTVTGGHLAAAATGDFVVHASFDVAAPVQPTQTDPNVTPSQDRVSVKLTTRSPIDLHAIDWNPSIHYTAAVDKDGTPRANPGQVRFDVTPEIEQYPQTSSTTVSKPWSPAAGTTRNAHVVFGRSVKSFAGQAVVTVKTRTGVVARGTVTIPAALLGGDFAADVPLNAALQPDTDYWFDVTVRDPAVSDTVSLKSFALTASAQTDLTPPAVLRWTGRQGIFPLAYRGWAVAGYNGDGARATQPLAEGDFTITIDENNKPTPPADPGFGDANAQSPAQDKSYAYLPALQTLTLPGHTPDLNTGVWAGSRANLAASATVVRSSRLGTDSIDLVADTSGGAGRAVNRVSITAPSAKLAAGLGPLSGSFGIAPSFGLVDYTDLNGDGYPDVVTPNSVTYTTQRGAYRADSQNPGQVAVTNQDLTLAVGVGLEAGLVDIKANSKGKTNATQGGAAAKGSDANDSGGGVGLGVGINVSWTSPNASGPSDAPLVSGATDPSDTYAEHQDKTGEVDGLPGAGAPIQQTLADVNGDGLADRVFTTAAGTFARYNLGYSFTAPVKLATGGFESQESYAGSLSLGFSTPWADFSGGAALNWNVDLSRYAWVDVNGDGILDQVHTIGNGNPPTVAFGTGTGVLPPVVYGDMARSTIVGTSAGQQSSLDRTNGLGGQVDFTVAIGPLCLVACYLIINPGASYQNSVSTTEIDLADVDGDGTADSLQTLDDNKLTVRKNLQGDTNLLTTVHNPLGGTITMGYSRAGNTVDNPGSVWTLASLTVDDGRPGDGIDQRTTTLSYQGLKADRLHRDPLGFASATEAEIDTDPASATYQQPLRLTRHTYLNNNIFDAGLETDTIVTDPDGGYLKGTTQSWGLHDVRGGAVMANLHSVASLGYSIAPQLDKVVTEVGTGGPYADGAASVGQVSTTTLVYDGLGDVIRQVDQGEDDDPNDDVVADISYSRCDPNPDLSASTIGCASDLPHANTSPIWSANLCPTWVSIPAEVTISNGRTGADRVVYRHRDGHSALCDNASVTHLEESVGNGSVATTDLTYDAWGSYDRIVYPVGENGKRYAVHYIRDMDMHASIGDVTDYDLAPGDTVDHFLGDGLTAGDDATPGTRSTATFDPLTAKVASRTDANGNLTSYTYDPLGRLASVTDPLSAPHPLVSFDYHLVPQDPHAVAHHYDVFHPGDTIDTASFADGLGRVVQTQQDASLFQSAGQPAATGVIVSGATIYDPLGHPISQYNPTASGQPLGTFDATAPTGPHTDSVYDLWDSVDQITAPGDRVTEIAYDYGQINNAGPTLYTTTETAPNGRVTLTYSDMRDVVRAVDDIPVGAPHQLTRYDSDGMGQLLTVTDPAGYLTTHSYDLLGRTLSTTTPDAGTVTYGYDADGQQTSMQTPNLRAANQKVLYHYGLHRLTGIDYPGTADDVSYSYGAMGAPDNGAGQVVREEDGARILTNAYDADGNLSKQVAEEKLHNWQAGDPRFQWTTNWSYDGLGRLRTLTYPDGELLTYGYDAGGLVNSIAGKEDGLIKVQVGVDPVTGAPIYQDQPHTWNYSYLKDQQYDVFLHRRWEQMGDGSTTEWTFDPNTQWLSRQQAISPDRDTKNKGAAYTEIQDLKYTYDSVGNTTTYTNDLPQAVPNLFSGPAKQTYTYDPYERVVGATGQFQVSTDKQQHYELALTYDNRGNVTSKTQNDAINNGKKDLVQSATTYSFDRTYSRPAPHQATGETKSPYLYDEDGNFLGQKDSKAKWMRQLTWDAADRLRSVNDSSSTTTYTYSDTGERAIERGPQGETATVNPWVTVRNGTELWKQVFAGNVRLGTQRDNGPYQEIQQYFLHQDLVGSTNIVTDYTGNTFQHQEYFATGEPWVTENSTVFRTPYQYGGGYVDEVRQLTNFGGRWYDQHREMFYSPDPVLVDDPSAIVDSPSLRSAYAYAGSNPTSYVDPTGNQFTKAQAKAFIKGNQEAVRRVIAADPALQGQIADNLKTRLPKSWVKMALNIDKAQSRQETFEMIDDIGKPFLEINVSTGQVKVSPGLFKQFTVRKGSSKVAADAQNGAANSSGSPAVNPAVGNGAAPSGSSGGSPGATGMNKPLPPTPTRSPKPVAKKLPAIPEGKAAGGDSAKGSM